MCGGFHVAVNDTVLMRGVKSVNNGEQDAHSRANVPPELLGPDIGERVALAVLRHVIRLASREIEIHDTEDIRMVDATQRADLSLEEVDALDVLQPLEDVATPHLARGVFHHEDDGLTALAQALPHHPLAILVRHTSSLAPRGQ